MSSQCQAAYMVLERYRDLFVRAGNPQLSLRPDEKDVVDKFFSGDRFVTLCDAIFGKVNSHHDMYDLNGPCGMDEANESPDTLAAQELLSAIMPGSPFVTVMELYSLPSQDFSKRMQTNWKGPTSKNEVIRGCTIDLPLSALFANHYSLLRDSSDPYRKAADLFPAMLFIPFWTPPVVTRNEASSLQKLSSLPCKPLPYFLLRLMIHFYRKCGNNCISFVQQKPRRRLRRVRQIVYELFSHYIWTFPSEGLTASSTLINNYIDAYVTPDVIKRLRSTTDFMKVSWTTTDTIAALLLVCPAAFGRSNTAPVLRERERGAFHDLRIFAQSLASLPFMQTAYMALFPKRGPNRVELKPCDSVYRSQSYREIEHLANTFMFDLLSTFRQCLMSLCEYPYCRCCHVNSVLSLWVSLLTPAGSSKRTYVEKHFEIFGMISVDALRCLSVVIRQNKLDDEGATKMREAFDLLLEDTVLTVCREVEEGVDGDALLNKIRRTSTLEWDDRHNIFSQVAINLLAKIIFAEEKREGGDRSAVYRMTMEGCFDLARRVFPNVDAEVERLRQQDARGGDANANSLLHDSEESFHFLTDAQRRAFFRGEFSGRIKTKKRFLLPTGNNRIPGNRNPLVTHADRNEYPMIRALTKVADNTIRFCKKVKRGSQIARCDRGHEMYLLRTDNYCCRAHPDRMAIWECDICGEVYGDCCIFLPHSPDGKELSVIDCRDNKLHYCELCNSVSTNCLMFAHLNTEYCADCASRPYAHFWSTRVIASYWAVSYLSGGILLILTLVVFGIWIPLTVFCIVALLHFLSD